MTFSTVIANYADACVLETTGWASERAERVSQRLQSVVPQSERFEVVVPWMDALSAFTVPGRYIYFTRRLLERCPDDESAAFVVAHEIAHHQLGHLRIFSHRLAALARVSHGWMAAASLHAIERAMYGPEHESAADHRALHLCLQAGYDGRKCLRLFDILTQHMLDFGDIDSILGLDSEADDDATGDLPWTTRLRTWTWEHMRGYPSLEDRRDALERYFAFRTATPIPDRPRVGFS